MKPGIAIAVHGGAYAIPEDEREAHRRGCRLALEIGLAILDQGGSSLDAVEAAVAALEEDGTFGAGRGAALNEDGEVELDAGMMDGHTLATGSVAALPAVPAAIRVARRVLDSQYAVLVGEGALRFTRRHGLPTCDPSELISAREWRRWAAGRGEQAAEWAQQMFSDTVGAVAADSRGHLTAATATGGSPRKPKGRVGDSPFIGCGLYANDATAAVSATGHGERLIPLVWAKYAADIVAGGATPQEAADQSVGLAASAQTRGGIIIVDHLGRIGVAWNTPQMAFAILGAGVDEIRDGPR
jgi:L-asparaginase / beta-aspartyl-peptidase